MTILGAATLASLYPALRKDRIFTNVSERVGTMMKEEMDFSGPVRMSDVEEVQLRVVQTVRQLEEAGQVTIVRGDSNDQFV